MRDKPKSNFEDKNGLINISEYEGTKENPDLLQWEMEYANECDRLAEIKALSRKKYWGRWYLNKNYLCTEVIIPAIGKHKSFKTQCYEIEVGRLGMGMEKDNGYTWVTHMSEKNWIGKKGLADLTLAISKLKEG